MIKIKLTCTPCLLVIILQYFVFIKLSKDSTKFLQPLILKEISMVEKKNNIYVIFLMNYYSYFENIYIKNN